MADSIITIKPCKKVETKHVDGTPNGWLLEVQSDRDDFTDKLVGNIYLTVLAPRAVKGYHIHAIASYHVTCLKGRVRSVVYKDQSRKEEIVYGDANFQTIKYSPGCAHLIENMTDEPAYVIIYRYPSWSPDIPEQLDIAPERIESEEAWQEIRDFVKKFQ